MYLLIMETASEKTLEEIAQDALVQTFVWWGGGGKVVGPPPPPPTMQTSVKFGDFGELYLR